MGEVCGFMAVANGWMEARKGREGKGEWIWTRFRGACREREGPHACLYVLLYCERELRSGDGCGCLRMIWRKGRETVLALLVSCRVVAKVPQ